MKKDFSISLGMTAKRLGMTKAAAALLCLLTVWNCSYDNLSLPQEAEEETVTDNPANTVAGKLIIKVSDALASEIENATDDEGNVELPEVKSLSADAIPLEITSMERLFPYAGKFEARTREAGLHKWYVIRYDESVATKSATAALTLPGVETIEIPHRIVRIGGEGPVEYIDPAKAVRTENAVFDDPMLGNQWHYYNDGSANSSVSGCDINVIPVWQRYTTGNPDVIVSVVDGGIDFDHEDLAANMWENPEETGERRFGFNFVTGGPKVTADDHGTHVAGTIAAVNNNGIGVCGVAGGNAATGQSGVKLMSCQIFQGEDGGDGAEAIKWGADHGAVISQNSWGYTDATYTPQYLKDAVDYFVRNAGIDENGAQTGPMIGGLVVFAAGNDNSSFGYPAEYEPIVAVSSVGADYKRAYYSNYGDWTDIIAPGGDAKKGNQVVSTLPDNKYGMMQGTSMACPHVSGVAALGLSYALQLGKKFTRKEFYTMLLTSVNDIDQYCTGTKQYINNLGSVSTLNLSQYKGQMGTGYLDAFRMLMNIRGITCIPIVPKNDIQTFDMQPYLSNSDTELKISKVEISKEDMEKLGITQNITIFNNKMLIKCTKTGSAIIKITFTAGTNSNSGMNGMSVTKEFALVSRNSHANNGGWL